MYLALMAGREGRRRPDELPGVDPDSSRFRPAIIAMALVLLLLSACGGLSPGDAALFSKALGEALQQQGYSRQNYTSGGESPDPKQTALAQQSGMSNEAVASVMLGLQHGLVANYTSAADLRTTSGPLGLVPVRGELPSRAADRLEEWFLEEWFLEEWLVRPGGDRVQSALEGFRIRPDQKRLDDFLRVAGAAGIEYGHIAGAGTLWFRDSVTNKFSAVAFVEHQDARLSIFIEGVATRTPHPKYRTITDWQVTITRLDLWRDDEAGRPPLGRTWCCENNSQRLTVVTSIDPNYPNQMRSHPPGFGGSAYVAEDQVISYTIGFEYPASAPAPAADLTLTADLGTGIDLATVLLGPSSHPAGMSAEINESNNTITWFFQDIMLPPNQSPPGGEGWVRFSARPRSDAASGTPLVALAAIRFDYNPPVETNEVAYTLDSGPPVTRVADLAAVQLSSSFEITWAGSDDAQGSGLQEVTLLVSEEGGPFSVVGTFSGLTIPFRGETGKTYGFATVGTDQVGHTEDLPEQPDAIVTVGHLLSPEPGWQLIGVPVVTARTPQQLLSRPGTSWATWDSSEQTYLPVRGWSTDWPAGDSELPGSGLWASFDPGTSYYITGQPVPLDRPYSIDLKPGWNLIANPFPVPIKWDLNAIRVSVAGVDTTLADAEAREWVEDFAWGWNGHSYTLLYDSMAAGPPMYDSESRADVHSELEPFKGYWFQSNGYATLVLPPPEFNR